MKNKLTPEMLAGGKLLRKLMKAFKEKQTPENLGGFFRALRLSTVIVPVTIKTEIEGIDPIKSNLNVDSDGRKHVKFTPDKVKDSEGNLYLPVFTSIDQMDKEYASRFKPGEMPFVQCMMMAEKMSGVKGIVIDMNTDSYIILNENFSIIRRLED